MIVLGVLLVVIAASAVALVLMAPAAMSNVVALTAIGVTVKASPLALFVAGAVSLALFGLGFPMITQGVRRKAKMRKELHQLRKDQSTAGGSNPKPAERPVHHDRPQHESSTGPESTTSG